MTRSFGVVALALTIRRSVETSVVIHELEFFRIATWRVFFDAFQAERNPAETAAVVIESGSGIRTAFPIHATA